MKNSKAEKIEELLKLYSNDIFNLAYNITGTKLDAEDALQNTFLQICLNIDEYRGDSNIFTWIYRIALNESLKIIKKVKLDAAHFTKVDNGIRDFANVIPDEIVQLSKNPEKEYIYKALLKEVKEGCHHFMLFRITEEQRIVFIFRIILGFSFSEIATILHTSEDVAKGRFKRAKENLQKHVNERCQLYNKVSKCTCEKCIGFALQMTPDLYSIVSEAANNPEYFKIASEKIDELEDIETVFKTLPRLNHKIDVLRFFKNNLR
jgi:RNA polymerase sigma factor (sigma-70 family)